MRVLERDREFFWYRAMQGVCFFLYIYNMIGCGGCGTLQGGDWYTRNIIYRVEERGKREGETGRYFNCFNGYFVKVLGQGEGEIVGGTMLELWRGCDIVGGGSESGGSPHKGAQHYIQEPFSIDQ